MHNCVDFRTCLCAHVAAFVVCLTLVSATSKTSVSNIIAGLQTLAVALLHTAETALTWVRRRLIVSHRSPGLSLCAPFDGLFSEVWTQS